MNDTVDLEIDCHAYPYHLSDDNYPECGPDNLTRMAETYGILIEFLPDHPGQRFTPWWYRVSGPPENVIGFLAAEYCGDEYTAREYVEALTAG